MLAEVYVDESYDSGQRPAPLLCVCGYVFYEDKAKEMSREWADILAGKALPYFHMSSCAHNTGVFSHLSAAECDQVARKMIALTAKYAEYGFGVSISECDYEEIFPLELRAQIGSAYTLCLRECFTMTRRWAEANNFDGRFAFFFEDGHESKRQANRILDDYRNDPQTAERFRYGSHQFMEKGSAIPLEAADILAWQWYTQCKRDPALPSRKDLVALLRPYDLVMDLNRDRLIEMLHHLLQRRLMQPSFSSGEGSSGAMPG